MISQTADYALRAVVYRGNQQGVSSTTTQIAGKIDTPAECLAKVMQGLSRAGIVDSQRGLHGGFALAHHPNKLAILDVVNFVDAFHSIARCSLAPSRCMCFQF